MRIAFVEIQNFRKLRSIRVGFHDRTTVLVGPNNSGKTSAMLCLGHFLVDPRRFTTNDFTLSNWAQINATGASWAAHDPETGPLTVSIDALAHLLPSLDIWLGVEPHEIHYVSHLLPTLDWSGGLLGVRLRLEPENVETLVKEYVLAYGAARKVAGSVPSGGSDPPPPFPVWPETLRDFLDRRLRSLFIVRAYSLDSTKLADPKDGQALPQPLSPGSAPIHGPALDGLIQIDEIGAQRGLGSAATLGGDDHDKGRRTREQRRLSEQLRRYYAEHLDPSDFPEPDDLKALASIKAAQEQFDERLRSGFSEALGELEGLGYPGLTDPRLTISTRLTASDGLNHDAAVQYEVLGVAEGAGPVPMRLPEEYNGLGYQNLISIVFRLMSFRDAWMQVGKAGKRAELKLDDGLAPLHLVLVEEPEAHLHAQVQQVFIRRAYEILRKHKDLGKSTILHTQLVVSTHSSHVTHESDFACLRYFRRHPGTAGGLVPTSTVVDVSEVFGSADKTPKFVMRYLTAAHSDLFFADAVIFVEGSAEGMLVPLFIRRYFKELDQRYITLLEIGGSHAHRLRNLVERLGLTTLVVTDIDSVDSGRRSIAPGRGKGLLTGNETLKTWLPELSSLDDLLDLPEDKKVRIHSELFSIRVAYQRPVKVTLVEAEGPVETIARTFEDSLVFENLDYFRQSQGDGAVGKFRDAINKSADPVALGEELHAILKDITKAAFALDLLFSKEPGELSVPTYLKDGLGWLQDQLKRKDRELLPAAPPKPKASV